MRKTIARRSALIIASLAVFDIALAQRGLSVGVIAHSISTRAEARAILEQEGWNETKDLRKADFILVVCRSTLSWPLRNSYASVIELSEGARSLLNITGDNFHIYLFKINSDLSVDALRHKSYKAD